MGTALGRKIVAVIALVTMAMFGWLSDAGAMPSGQATTTIDMGDFFFAPKEVTVAAGTTVTWKNVGAVAHTTKADDGLWNSGNMNSGAVFSVKLTTAGTYNYYCAYHGGPNLAGMAGKIVVTAAPAPVVTTSSPPRPTAQPTAQPQTGPTPSVSVRDQTVGADMTVVVPQVVAAQDGWVAFHKNGPDGKILLTPLAGLIHVSAGTINNLRAKLDEIPADGKLYAMLHIDVGFANKYEFPGGPDVPVTVNGQVVVKPFTVSRASGTPTGLPNTGATDTSTGLLAGLGFLAILGGAVLTWSRRRKLHTH